MVKTPFLLATEELFTRIFFARNPESEMLLDGELISELQAGGRSGVVVWACGVIARLPLQNLSVAEPKDAFARTHQLAERGSLFRWRLDHCSVCQPPHLPLREPVDSRQLVDAV